MYIDDNVSLHARNMLIKDSKPFCKPKPAPIEYLEIESKLNGVLRKAEIALYLQHMLIYTWCSLHGNSHC